MCSAIKWANANAANKKGKTKCREKNLLSVAFETEKPPPLFDYNIRFYYIIFIITDFII